MEVIKGRMYDYNNGRFLSVDPFIQSPTSTQSMNPYTYIFNNPLSGVDPTGYYSRVCVNGLGCIGSGSTPKIPVGNDPYPGCPYCVDTDSGKGNDDGSEDQQNKDKDIVDLGTVVVTGSVITAEGFLSGGGQAAEGIGLFSEASIYALKGASAIVGIFIPTSAGDSTYNGGYLNEENDFDNSDDQIQNSRGMENVGTPATPPPPNGDDEDGNNSSLSASEKLEDLNGKSRTEADKILRKQGFTNRGTTPGGYTKYYHPDGSRVQIRPNGEVVRTGPKVNSLNPNAKGFRPRIGPDGKPTQLHSTGEFLK